MSTLYLPDGVRATVWRLVKARLKADLILNQPRDMALVFFDGTRDATRSLADYAGPTILFLATVGRQEWYTERSIGGALVISYQVKIPDLDDEDLLNLQEAIEGAFYPDDEGVFQQSLFDAGVTALPQFVQPLALSPQTAGMSGMLTPSGQIVIGVERRFPA